MRVVDISVNVCTYNRAEMLRGASESLICQETDGGFSYDNVVIDNVSTDDTKAVVEQQVSKYFPVSIRYIFEENKGVSQARNRGVKESQGAWVAFFDGDELAERRWLKEIFSMTSITGDYCVGCTMLLSLPIEPAIPLGKITRSILGEQIYYKEFQVYNRKYLPGTGNVLIKRSMFDSIEAFDTSMLRGGSDHDFFCRVWAAVFRMWAGLCGCAQHLPCN